MAIIVTLASGENVTLSVLSTDKVSTVKRQIQDLKGISLGKQVIMYEGNRLNNEDTLSKKGIDNGSMLTLVDEDSKKDGQYKEGRFS